MNITANNRQSSRLDQLSRKPTKSMTSKELTPNKNIRISKQVVVATEYNSGINIKWVPMNSLMEESKKLTDLNSRPENQ